MSYTICIAASQAYTPAACQYPNPAASSYDHEKSRPVSEKIALKSPDGKIELTVNIGDEISYSVSQSGVIVLDRSRIGMDLADGTKFGVTPKLVSKKIAVINNVIEAQFYRFNKFTDNCQELNLKFKGDYGVIFRVYDDGVAYRFYSMIGHDIDVSGELAEFNFDKDYLSYLAHSKGKKEQFAMSFQNFYSVKPFSEADTRLAFLPSTVDLGNGRKITITESDLESYPGMFLKVDSLPNKDINGSKYSLKGVFAPMPAELERTPKRFQEYVKSRSSILARVRGTRSFPWRILAITEKDTQLPVNNLVYALASPNRIGDCSWVKPGKVAWDWWNDCGLYDVDFKAGVNMDTYKYFIDFASRFGIEYIVLDAGWYNTSEGDLFKVVPELDLPVLVAYGKSKNVEIVLWAVLKVLDDQLEQACKYYSDLGIKGFKVDFLDRDDQMAVDMVYRVAEAAARHKLMLDFHGFYKPTGINRTFPNVVNFEGVFGLEELKWSTEKVMPEYDVTLPFIRMMAGPVDYTPGAMRNATKKDFAPIYSNPMSQGTRCHQLATYIVFDSPFTMLCDSPTLYEQNKECTEFIASIPMQYEETKILAGELAQYIVTARRHEQGCCTKSQCNNSQTAKSRCECEKSAESQCKCEKSEKSRCNNTKSAKSDCNCTESTKSQCECEKSDCKQCSEGAAPRAYGDAIWTIGGLTNWTARDIEIDLTFLEDGKTYTAIIFKDGPNAERQGADYAVERHTVNRNTKLKIHLASGGGFAIRIEP